MKFVLISAIFLLGLAHSLEHPGILDSVGAVVNIIAIIYILKKDEYKL
jgi:hypothetical protein